MIFSPFSSFLSFFPFFLSSFLLIFFPSLSFSSFSFPFLFGDIFIFRMTCDLDFICDLQKSCYVLFDENKPASVNIFILDNPPSKWKLHCWLRQEVYMQILWAYGDSMAMRLSMKNEKTGGKKKTKQRWQWLWNEETGDWKGLRMNSFKGHVGFPVYIGVASTTSWNCWDLGTLSSFKSILSLIKQCKPGNPSWLQTMLWSQACIWMFSIKTLK